MRLDHTLLLLPLFEALKPLQKILKHRAINQPEVSYTYMLSRNLAEPVFMMKFDCFDRDIYFWYFYQEQGQWYAHKCGEHVLWHRYVPTDEHYQPPKFVTQPMTVEQLAEELIGEIYAIQA